MIKRFDKATEGGYLRSGKLSIEELNRAFDYIERAQNFTVEPPLELTEDYNGFNLRIDKEWIWAVIQSSSSSSSSSSGLGLSSSSSSAAGSTTPGYAYAWQEVYPDGGGGWQLGLQFGTRTNNVAYEINWRTSVAAGTIVQLYRGVTDEWLFTSCCGGNASTLQPSSFSSSSRVSSSSVSSGSSSSHSSGSVLVTPCCDPDVFIPTPLYCTLTGCGGCLEGAVIIMDYDPVENWWRGYKEFLTGPRDPLGFQPASQAWYTINCATGATEWDGGLRIRYSGYFGGGPGLPNPPPDSGGDTLPFDLGWSCNPPFWQKTVSGTTTGANCTCCTTNNFTETITG